MSKNTNGKIKGFVNPEEIFTFIKQRYDNTATNNIAKRIIMPISKCNWDYTINDHSEDNNSWYEICGFIFFRYKDEYRMLFYSYDNLNHFENLNYYINHGLEDMVRSETTHLSLNQRGSSVEIIKSIITHFGSGWIDENDCDSEPYYAIAKV